MFADIVGFTSMSKQVAPAIVMGFLNKLYSAFDELVGIFNVYKVRKSWHIKRQLAMVFFVFKMQQSFMILG